MSNTTQASVVSFVEHAADLAATAAEQAAIDRATTVFTEFADHRWYYHDATVADRYAGAAVVPLATEAGRECMAARLQETSRDRVGHLATVLAVVGEAPSLAAAVATDDLVQACRHLGAISHPDGAYLYDGTNWTFGSPILHDDRLAEITDHHDPETLFVVEVRLTH